jgi:hypothetical protein
VVAFLTSLIVSGAMVAVVVQVARRRQPGTPLTWGEAFAAGLFTFTLLFLVYGVVPHQWLAFADNTLKWRSDKIGIPLGPFGKALDVKGNVLFPHGIPLPTALGGHGRFIVTAQVLRDIVAAGLYIVFLLAQIVMWLWWQKRGQKKAETPELTSAFGRPLLRRA